MPQEPQEPKMLLDPRDVLDFFYEWRKENKINDPLPTPAGMSDEAWRQKWNKVHEPRKQLTNFFEGLDNLTEPQRVLRVVFLGQAHDNTAATKVDFYVDNNLQRAVTIGDDEESLTLMVQMLAYSLRKANAALTVKITPNPKNPRAREILTQACKDFGLTIVDDKEKKEDDKVSDEAKLKIPTSKDNKDTFNKDPLPSESVNKKTEEVNSRTPRVTIPGNKTVRH